MSTSLYPSWMRELAAAVLLQAIEDLEHGTEDQMVDAAAWFMCADEPPLPFNFMGCCTILDLDPKVVLERVKDRKKFRDVKEAQVCLVRKGYAKAARITLRLGL
jgi:hypothetical protein